jgi:hypothetical protein
MMTSNFSFGFLFMTIFFFGFCFIPCFIRFAFNAQKYQCRVGLVSSLLGSCWEIFGDLLAELPSRNLAVYYQKCPSKRMIYLDLAIKHDDFLNLPTLTHAKNTLIWVKQCHEPPMTGNGKHTSYQNGHDCGMVYDCFTHNFKHQSGHWRNHCPCFSLPQVFVHKNNVPTPWTLGQAADGWMTFKLIHVENHGW